MTSRRNFLLAIMAGIAASRACLVSAQSELPPPPYIESKACIVIDAVTGISYFEKSADQRRPVASTQKLLSALVAVEVASMDRVTTVQAEETKVEPHKLFLKAGERLPLRTLLYAMLIESCNDCAHCMARSCGGSIAGFAGMMNRRAAQLGMRNSHFVNPSGLPAEGQYSTARDMSRLARAAIYNPTLRSIVGRSEMTITRGDGRIKKLRTTNYLLRPDSSFYLPICTGMKTGWTNASGKCLVSSATVRGRAVICVMLGSKDGPMAWRESRAMLQWALGVNAP